MRARVLPHLVLFSLLGLALLAGPATAWYPKATQVEVATATWCSSCPTAYAGVEANKAKFDNLEFNAIRYYASESGGQFGCAASTSRIAYYGALGYPEMHFDGTTTTHRVTSETAAGKPYEALITSLMDDPGYFRIVINSVNFSTPTGDIDLDIQVKQDIADISNLKLRMILTEDNLIHGSETLHDVTRAALTDVALTVDGNGEVQSVDQTFAVDPSWVEENLSIIAFIQNDATKEVLASATTDAAPEFSFRFYTLGDKFEVGYPTDEYYFEWFRTYNTSSSPQMFTFSVTIDGPPDWYTSLCGAGICYGPTYSQLLMPGQYAELKIEAVAPSSGAAAITLNITTDVYPDPAGRSVVYTYVTDDIDVLVVDDDGLQNHQQYFTDALDHYDVDYAVLDAVYTQPTADLLGFFDIVIWAQGLQYPTLTASDRDAITTYLSGGGNLFLSGQDIGWELSHINQFSWMQNTLHTFFFNDVASDMTLGGVTGNQISDGIDLTLGGGDGADNQDSPSALYPADGTCAGIWSYTPDEWGAVRVDTGTYRLVYFGFGFEGIDNEQDRFLVMHRVLNWFRGIADAGDPPIYRQALSVFPNPASGGAAVRFALPAAERATVSLFGIDGRLLRTLAAGELGAGSHVIRWDGTDARGSELPAGLYYCRVDGERTRLLQKVVVLD